MPMASRVARPMTLLLRAACERGTNRAPAVDYIPVAGNPQLPFSDAVRVGHMLYLAGQLGTDSTGHLIWRDRWGDPSGPGEHPPGPGKERIVVGPGRQMHRDACGHS